ncbi:MAG: PDZ domain-containing protein [Phycisphaerales bacterium JB065]
MQAKWTPALLIAAAAVATCAAPGFAAEIRPDAALLQFPDVSKSHIVFAYANDLWLVPREGGAARKLVSPPGGEGFPRFNPTGDKIAFMGNYEGGRDLYVIPVSDDGPTELATRLTHHPSSEILSDWTPDGESIIYSSSGMTGMTRAPQMFKVSQEGGQPEKFPIPYGSAGTISPDGTWLAYTPNNRDFRTWKRYRGGMASDIWLLNLNTNESVRMTDFEGTDTQPMWAPDGKSVYYLSDNGPEHRLNIWKYEIGSRKHTQITHSEDYDIKFPSIGPGPRGRGEIVYQQGPDLVLLDLSNNRTRTVEVVIPGDRPTLRPKMIDFSNYMAGGSVSATGKQVVTEARGDIWTLPAEEGKGIARNLTRTSGAAERNPIWSPDGRWIAYVSDETDEYEVYVTQSDGKGETRQLTSGGNYWRYLSTFSPDSEKIVFTDNTGAAYLLDVETGEHKEMFKDLWGNTPSISFSHDGKWIATALSLENGMNAVHLYDLENDELHQVTQGFFSAKSPAFDREGKFLYFVSTMNFSPEYSAIDSTFIYTDSDRILAVPLNSEVENPNLSELDEETWEEPEDENADDSDAEGEETEGSDEASEDSDESEEATSNWDTDHPLFGKWSGTMTGFAAIGMPEDTIPLGLTFLVDHDGNITGTAEVMGESDEFDGELRFNASTGEFYSKSTEQGMTSILKGTVNGDSLSGTWELVEMGVSGTWSVTRTTRELSDEELEGADSAGGSSDEPVVIDLDGFEARALMLPIPPGAYGGLAVNDKNQLLFMSVGDGMPSIKLFDITDEDGSVKNVVTGVGGYSMSGDGKKLAVNGPSGPAVISAAAGQSLAKVVPTDSMMAKVDPREEWEQILRDAWRIQRTFFYDPGLHGVDWDGVYDRYSAMLPDCTTREDVSFLIREMISELNVGHAYYWGGDAESQPMMNVGLLGADFELDRDEAGNEAYRIAHIYEGADWDADARGPLSQFGVDVSVGDYILAVNGVEIDTSKDIFASLIGTAGKTTLLTVSDQPSWGSENEREVVVKPVGSDTDLRYRSWIETNRKYVEEVTDGKVGYIYVPNTGVDGQNDLFRQFYGQIDKEGLIIDERWNGGGQIPNRFIELLNRPRTNYWARRHGKDWPWPYDSHQGAQVMLINGLAGSGGDMFPWLFRESGLGKIIGTRTWGGLVGISGNPSLIDGGYTAVPTFGFYEKDGTWGIEGHGVDPDIEVIDDPGLMIDDGDPTTVEDPQLDAAIQVVLEEIKANPYRAPQRPAGPDRSGMGIKDSDR